ncbi:HAD family phosphatase [Streptosporangiaceae bacterium NEAU-GS5]|nr:HAD family phosphatase [Streptosporangiaceae bacterium NEAU-GS5]
MDHMTGAALFDLDGTLINTELRSRAVWAMFLTNHGIAHDEELLRSFMGRRGRDVLPALLPEADLDAVRDEIEVLLTHPGLPDIVHIPGAADLVRRVSAEGWPIGLVTSARRAWAEARLADVGVRDLVQTIVSDEDVAVGKPDPAGYVLAAERLRADPAKCVAFEDSLAGIAAAKAAGMTCVGVATTHHPDELAAADLVVADLSEIDWPISGGTDRPS